MPTAAANPPVTHRIGIDLGGTKIAGIVLDPDGNVTAENRRATPRDDYTGTIATIQDMVAELRHNGEIAPGTCPSVGIGIPGSCVPDTGLIQNANSTWLNQRPFKADLEQALNQSIKMENDANCFAVSEATDGSAADYSIVFGIIIGTGCGGGIVINRDLINGPLGVSGEWGHMPLPMPTPEELPGPRCWCGRTGCMETWVSGPALTNDHQRVCDARLTADEIATMAASGDANAMATLDRHADRLARGIAAVVNIVDPDIIVLGGGLSEISSLYERLPGKVKPHIFADDATVTIRPPKWGPASGVRGAARL